MDKSVEQQIYVHSPSLPTSDWGPKEQGRSAPECPLPSVSRISQSQSTVTHRE